ncbi:MAG: sensor histidine kinase [Endomicrobiia bacterium]
MSIEKKSINIQSIIWMLADSIGIEAAENILDKSIREVGFDRKVSYSEEEFLKICENLKKKGGYIKIFATLVASPVFREIQYQKMIEKEKKEREEIETLYKALQKSNEELKKMQEELIKKERLSTIGTLSSSIAHELRNPLTSIKNIAFFLKKYLTEEKPKVKELIELLNKEIEVMNKIITDLLEFSRVTKLEKVKISIEKVIDEALNSVVILEKIKVIKEIPSDLKEVYIDPIRMRQVFVNLITNACDAMSDGGELKIVVKIEPAEMKIDFSDTGHGISKEVISHIFEPLFTTKAKGIGLGLAVVRSIIEQHNGKITVESEVGKGTTFSIILPIEE